MPARIWCQGPAWCRDTSDPKASPIAEILVSAAGGLAMGHALVGAEDRPRRVVVAKAGVQAPAAWATNTEAMAK